MRFNRSEPGLIFSSVAHAALFAAALVGFSQPHSFAEQQEAVPVEVINENELRQMMRGVRDAPKPTPAPQQKADRVAEVNERKPDAPMAQQDVEAPPPPRRDLAAEKAEQEKAAAAQAAKEAEDRALREMRAAEAQRQREAAEKQRAAAAAAAASAAEKARAAAAEKARAEEEAEERREAELERQRKQEEAKKAADAKRIADEKRAADDKRRKEAEAKALREKQEREAEEAEERREAELEKKKLAEQARKAAEAKAAADAKRAAEAKQAADEKARREAEARQTAARAQSDGKPFNPSDIEKLLQNKQRATTTGSTGAQPQRQASLGTATGADAKLNPSQREALIGILRDQMTRCLSIPPGSNPQARPSIRVQLNQDGSLSGMPSVTAGDAAVGQASVRAIRGCAPYRIPAQYASFYNDWRS
ncbi:MAG: cell envelope integrity protein TolA, partial [Beijerinckiaceae bacterium]